MRRSPLLTAATILLSIASAHCKPSAPPGPSEPRTACDPGTTPVDGACEPLASCGADGAACDENARCVATGGTEACVCNEGWFGDGSTCNPVHALDCTADNPACPPIDFVGDTPARGSFAGWADPTVEPDPATGTTWIAYSRPRVEETTEHVHGALIRIQIPVVETHLARFETGSSATFDVPLWTTKRLQVSAAGYQTSSETPNLVAEIRNGVAHWYAVVWQYVVPRQPLVRVVPGLFTQPDIYKNLGSTSTLLLAHAGRPEDLASDEASTLVLQSEGTKDRPNGGLYLSGLSDELTNCALWGEPALAIRNDRLYLVAQCWYLPDGEVEPDQSRYFYGVFRTGREGPIAQWRWEYRGKFADHRDAQDLGGHEFINQLDLAESQDGTLLAIVTPADPDERTNRDFHHGCRAVEVESLDAPALRRDAADRLVVRANVTTTDLDDQVGSAACTYNPQSPAGILMTRRTLEPSMRWSIHETGIHPGIPR